MPHLVWTDRMSVGVDGLDSDHKELMRLINRLQDALDGGEGRAILDRVFDSLAVYTETHFAREEQVMEACSYPAIAEHRREHQNFLLNMRYIRDRYFQGEGVEAGYDLLDQLREWWSHHILLQDMDYKSSVEAFDVSAKRLALTPHADLPAI